MSGPSLRSGIDAKCRECGGADGGARFWRVHVSVCPVTECPLWPHRPLARRNVPCWLASRSVADLEAKLGRLQRMVLAAIRDAGWLGLTADELCARLKSSRWTVQPRTSELRRKGLIRDSGQRRRNASGKQAIVWVAA